MDPWVDVMKTGGEWGGGVWHRSKTEMTADGSRERNILKFDKIIGSR